jgi:hypothetical protein
MSVDQTSASGGNTPVIGVLPKVLFRVFVWLCVFLLAVAILGPFIVSFVFEILTALASGWWKFLVRVLPRVSLSWDLVGMAAV